ncbi:activating signal cointegrator 1 complex subunit 2-like [Athene cunicularia]|uniref:Activating signal cointegrator 1 complex subunit 2-like n=1 Tax=Athene cunicularia TaxID=194338 RepID=A0A663LXR9_ATHCN|nr:activating signal cointegrator 1 complex subunit 2-like [Athene cunicularia]
MTLFHGPTESPPALAFCMILMSLLTSPSFPWQDHFVQDPAVLRERAEARRLAYLARKGHKHDNSAVVGNVKGHGQNRETVQERRKKEANKSTRANHNRRVMADRKRNKGMIPS